MYFLWMIKLSTYKTQENPLKNYLNWSEGFKGWSGARNNQKDNDSSSYTSNKEWHFKKKISFTIATQSMKYSLGEKNLNCVHEEEN